MKDGGAARRYATAILKIAVEKKAVKSIGEELSSFAQVYKETPDLRKVLLHPGVEPDKKRGILKGIADKMKLSATVLRSAETLLENGRIDMVVAVSNSYKLMADVELGEVTVSVSSAHALSDVESAELEKIFSSITGKKAKLETSVDGSLIGGIVARVGSRVYDGSVSNQLKLMGVKLGQEV